MFRRTILLLLAAAALPLFPSCQSVEPVVAARNARIQAEPRGDYYIGRRYFTNKVRYWGYLRRPGQLWEDGQLVIMDENRVKTPDRLSEMPSSGNAHGYDHNSEYIVRGVFSNRLAYDPNADMELPVFSPASFKLVSPNPGFLFSPRERYDPRYIPAREVPRTTPNRM